MHKLLDAYLLKPTLANAKKIVAHGRKHPFSLCLVNDIDQALIVKAATQVEEAGR
jgi:hypothetical protein